MKNKFLSAVASLVFATAVLAAPANVIVRVPTGTPMPPELVPLLVQWRQSGLVAHTLLLTHGQVENPGPDRKAQFETFAVLEFSSERAADLWDRDAAPALPAGLIVRRADVLVHGELSPRDRSHSFFIVNTYTPLVSRERYNEFVQGYIKPLYESMRATTHLVRSTMYHERGEVGQADALTVLEYRDATAFTAMGALKTSIRDKLTTSVPTYAQFDKIKDTLRTDGHGTLCTYTALPVQK